jgi:hypothetical protein
MFKQFEGGYKVRAIDGFHEEAVRVGTTFSSFASSPRRRDRCCFSFASRGLFNQPRRAGQLMGPTRLETPANGNGLKLSQIARTWGRANPQPRELFTTKSARRRLLDSGSACSIRSTQRRRRHQCRHEIVMNVDNLSGDLAVPSLGCEWCH